MQTPDVRVYLTVCACVEFTLWYVDRDRPERPIAVCECGHPRGEHLAGRTCLGVVEVDLGVPPDRPGEEGAPT